MANKTGLRTGNDDLAAIFGLRYTGANSDFAMDEYMRLRASHALPAEIPAGKRLPTMGMMIGAGSKLAQMSSPKCMARPKCITVP